MRVLLAIGSSEIGGGQIIFLSCLREFLKNGCSVVVALPDGPCVELVRSYGVKVHIIDFDSPLSLLRIARMLETVKVDIVNTYLTKCSLLFSIVNIFYRVPLCCTLLNAITHEKLNGMQRRIYPCFYHLLHKLCDGIIVNSEQNRDHFIKTANMDGRLITVIYSGIDNAFFSSSHGHKGNNEFTIGTVCRLSPEKGVEYLVDALRLLKNTNYRCFIVGDGPLREQLESKVKNAHLQDKVIFAGFQRNVIPFMQQMDVVIVPSLNETFGISIVEAFALRKLVIASDIGGIPELIQHAVTGLLFPAKDSSALAEMIKYAYTHKSETDTIRDNAYQYAKAHFTSEIMARNTMSYYDKLITQYKAGAESPS